jgi:hypothetical protein
MDFELSLRGDFIRTTHKASATYTWQLAATPIAEPSTFLRLMAIATRGGRLLRLAPTRKLHRKKPTEAVLGTQRWRRTRR